MENTSTYKILSVIAISLTAIFLTLTFLQLTELFEQLSEALKNLPRKPNLTLIYSYMTIGLFTALALFLITFRTLTMVPKKIKEEEIEEDTLQKEKNEALLAKQLEEENRLKEEYREETTKRILEGLNLQRSVKAYSERLLSKLAKEFNLVQGLFFYKEPGGTKFKMYSSYAFYSEEDVREFAFGEGISGQVAKDQKFLNIANVPDDYITVLSGLGSGTPKHLAIFPVVYRDESIAVIELASFEEFNENSENILTRISERIGERLLSFDNQKVEPTKA